MDDSEIFVFEKLNKIERYINANYYHIRDCGLLDNVYADVIWKIFQNPEVIWLSVLRERKLVSAIRWVIDEIRFRYNQEKDESIKFILISLIEKFALNDYLPYFKKWTEKILEEAKRLRRTKVNRATAKRARKAQRMREKAEQEAWESKDTVRIPPLKRDADPCKEK